MSRVIDRFAIRHRASPLSWLRTMALRAGNGLTSPLIAAERYPVRFGFVVGCGHSGTTLLVSRIANHPEVEAIGRESFAFDPQHGLYASRQILREWSERAQSRGRSLVVEKTPKHVHCIERIRRLLPEAPIVAIVRDPLDTVASLTRRFGEFRLCLERWLIDNRELLRWRSTDGIYCLRYEDLVDDPEARLQGVCDHLGLSWSPLLLGQGEPAFGRGSANAFVNKRRDQVAGRISRQERHVADALSAGQCELVRRETAQLAAAFGYGA